MSILTHQIAQAVSETNQIAEFSRQILHELIVRHNAQMRRFWHNENGVTPQEICNQLGTSAQSLFELALGLKTYILSIDPTAVLEVPEFASTFNGDGTVTITDQPYAS